MSKKTLAVKLDEDGDLYNDFSEVEAGRETTSETMRTIMRAGLESMEDGDDPPNGLFTSGLGALGGEWYSLARDAVLMAGLALVIQSVISAYGPVWAGTLATVVTVGAVGIAAVAFLGAVAGLSARLMDAVGYHPLSDTPTAEDGEKA